MKELHPLRLQYKLFSDANPWMAPVDAMAQQVRGSRHAVAADNALLQMQTAASERIVGALDIWRDLQEQAAEWLFLSVYGSPLLQAAVGIDPADARPLRRAGKSTLHRELVEARIRELRSEMDVGGLREGFVRAALYAGVPRAALDERGIEALRRLRGVDCGGPPLTLGEFKAMVRKQFFLLLIDQEAAVAALPKLLPSAPEARRMSFHWLRQVLSARGDISGDVSERLRRIAGYFGVDPETDSDDWSGPPPKAVRMEGTRAS